MNIESSVITNYHFLKRGITMKKAGIKPHFRLRFNSKLMLLIDLSQNLLFLLFLVPLINLLIEFTMNIAGISYLTSANTLDFLTSPPAIILTLFLLITITMFLLSKLASLVYYCNYAGKLRKPYLFRIVSFGMIKSLQCLKRGKLGLILYTIPCYILSCLPILVGITFHADLGSKMGTYQEAVIKGCAILLLILLSIISLEGVFTIHICVRGDLKFREGYSLSKKLLKGRFQKMLIRFLSINAALTTGYFLLYYLLILLTALYVCFFTDKTLAVTTFLSAYPQINVYAAVFYSIFVFVINVNLISTLLSAYEDENLRRLLPGDLVFPDQVYYFKKQHRHLVNLLLVGISLASLINFAFIIRNDSLYLGEALTGIQISSHRGNSHIAPENTLPALENAIIAKSDFAEIDVQETKDGVLVLLHDFSLYRTAGVRKYIWNVTIGEVRQMDAGSWFAAAYRETKIPTLEEALVYCKGKIKLNIEIKTNNNETDLEEKLVGLIEQYDYVDQCVVSSTDYNSLVKVKELDADIRTGFILSGVYGNFYYSDYIDFFSIRSTFLTKSIVDKAHKAGKEVHAWTVDSKRELERMKTVNVDCVITDNPTLARQILYQDDTNDTFLELINRMFRYRSLYSLTHN
jgi:glycerophosphoryl diester phosphodiesterase